MGICGSSEDVDDGSSPRAFNGGPPVSLSISQKQLDLYDSLNTPVGKEDDGVEVADIGIDMSADARAEAVEAEFVTPDVAEAGEPIHEEPIKSAGEEEVAEASVPECKYIEGHLKKKSPGLLGGWQIRFCVLQNDSNLSYYGAVCMMS
jgi:hypothetical protein